MEQSYSASSIRVLEGLEAVRKRPGMFIGDTEDGSGLAHMVRVPVDEALSQHHRSRVSRISVKVTDSVVTYQDNDRGNHNVNGLVTTLTSLNCGSRYGHNGLLGVGLSVVNALSSRFEMEVNDRGHRYCLEYAMGTKVSGPRPLKACTEGTTIRFEPDFSIFSRSLNLQDVRDTFVDLSVFQPNMVLQLNGETFWAPGGLSDLVVGLAGGPQTGLTPVFFRGEMAAVQAQLALLWKPSGQPQVMGYVRQERVEVGSHIEGFWEGLRQAFVEYEPALKGVHLPAFVEVMAPGLVAAVEVKFTDSRHRPSYYNLDDDEAAQAVCCILGQGLGQELRNNPSLRQELFARIP